MRKKFVAGLVVLAGAFGLAATPSQAYLHVANAAQACVQGYGVYYNAWANNTYGPGFIVQNTGSGTPYAVRWSDSQVVVVCGWKSFHQSAQVYAQGELKAYIAGSDANASIVAGGGWPQWTYLGRALCNPNFCYGTPPF